MSVRTTRVALVGATEPCSRLLVDPDGDDVLVLLAARGPVGPCAVVDVADGRVRTARGLPVLHDVVARTGEGLVLLTARGLTRLALRPAPRVLGHAEVPGRPGRAALAHEAVLVAPGRALLGVRGRARSCVVDVDDGEQVRATTARAPFLLLPDDRLWSLGSGAVLDLVDGSRTAAPRGLAAVRVDGQVVAVLGEEVAAHTEPMAHALLRDLAPDRLLARLAGPWADLRLARLDGSLTVLDESRPDWLHRAVGEPSWHPLRLTRDGRGQVVLAGPDRLTVLDPRTLQRSAATSTTAPATCWPDRPRAAWLDGEALVLADWS